MDLSQLLITRSAELGINQKCIVDRTHEPACAKAGGRRLSRPHISQLWRNDPMMIHVPEPPTVAALAYALECTKLEVYLAALHTIGVWKSDGPGGIRILTFGTNGLTVDQIERVVRAGESAMAREVDLLTRTEQR